MSSTRALANVLTTIVAPAALAPRAASGSAPV
jgi:hypothetical protein